MCVERVGTLCHVPSGCGHHGSLKFPQILQLKVVLGLYVWGWAKHPHLETCNQCSRGVEIDKPPFCILSQTHPFLFATGSGLQQLLSNAEHIGDLGWHNLSCHLSFIGTPRSHHWRCMLARMYSTSTWQRLMPCWKESTLHSSGKQLKYICLGSLRISIDEYLTCSHEEVSVHTKAANEILIWIWPDALEKLVHEYRLSIDEMLSRSD